MATRRMSMRRNIIAPACARRLEDHLDRRRTGLFAERDGEPTILAAWLDLLAVYQDAPRHNAGQLQAYLVALGDEGALAFAEPDCDAVFGRFGGDPAPGVFAFSVAEAVPRVFVQRGFAGA